MVMDMAVGQHLFLAGSQQFQIIQFACVLVKSEDSRENKTAHAEFVRK
ncbi:hypothetical protein Pla110_05170 [Polystyrenella longa]|uniref:Uncharacterized protein n=1 Tax=Polystyrenella longa TaxID=2528007 RepID=A0A518CHV7_9PLAN|nr:hypothetical protein Pla110_05170 [Polystyrenella longa]